MSLGCKLARSRTTLGSEVSTTETDYRYQGCFIPRTPNPEMLSANCRRSVSPPALMMNKYRAVDHRLAHMDQVSFLGLRALGYGTLAQVVWMYHRPADIGGLRRLHRNLGHGLLGRR